MRQEIIQIQRVYYIPLVRMVPNSKKKTSKTQLQNHMFFHTNLLSTQIEKSLKINFKIILKM